MAAKQTQGQVGMTFIAWSGEGAPSSRGEAVRDEGDIDVGISM